MVVDSILKRDILSDDIIRMGIRYLLKNRLQKESRPYHSNPDMAVKNIVSDLSSGPIAVNTSDANEQHYEVPARFFEIVLGPKLKYSSGIWNTALTSLEESEKDMLDLSIERSEIQNAGSMLDLGCGWGSFSLYAAERFPALRITAVSNSNSQRDFIQQKAKEKGLKNLKVITSDINDFQPDETFDRIVSVEMFEHVRNYKELFGRLHRWLKPNGKLFIHIFNHRKLAYKFDQESESDWMARHFFSGGIMPADNLFFHFTDAFETKGHWQINGIHYSNTLEAWLKRMDVNKHEIMAIFENTYGKEAKKFWVYWRIFFLACSETFAYNKGNEWGVSHYLFQKS